VVEAIVRVAALNVGPLHPAFETDDALIPALYVARNSASWH
jgi:hypothetical protein